MYKALLLLVLTLSVIHLQAQTMAKNDALKFDADYYLMEKDFGKAKNNYLNILKSEPDNADVKYRLGICYLNSEDEKDKAISYLEEAVQKVSEKYSATSFKETNAPVDALFLLGSAYRVNNEIDKAIDAYNRYKAYLDPKDNYNIEVIDQYIRNCNLARDMLKNPISMITVNLGKPINTDMPNFNAVISGDGKTLVYTSPGRQGYDIFSSTFVDTAWTTPKNITSVLGTGKYMKTSCLAYDGLTLLLVLDDQMNSDIYISHFVKNKWSKAEPLNKDINSKSNETHASLSADGKVLYFTSNRKGGEGDMDIYRSEPNEKGAWGKPENLGPAINTPFNEETPFVTDDGQTLFFSSEGHDGIGGYDVFRYDFNNPGAGAVNIGYPLNTTDNDLFFMPWGNGTTAYYSFRGSDTYGGRDIYRITIPKAEATMAVEEPVEEEEAVVAVEEPVQEEAAIVAVEEPVTVAFEETVSIEEPVVEDVIATVEEEDIIKDTQDVAVLETSEPIVEEVPEYIAETVPVEQTFTKLTPSGAFTTSDLEARSFLIQIMALKKPVDIAYFHGLPGITIAYSNDQWYRYTTGNTIEALEAEKLLKQLIEQGYHDAFIRKKKLIPQFTIQVMAVPGPVVNLNRFSNLPDISVKKGDDNFCRYTTGEFETKDEAIASLEQIKELGYKKAFIAKIGPR